MTLGDSDHDAPERILHEFLETHGLRDDDAWHALLTSHPQHADALKQLGDALRAADDALEGLRAPLNTVREDPDAALLDAFAGDVPDHAATFEEVASMTREAHHGVASGPHASHTLERCPRSMEERAFLEQTRTIARLQHPSIAPVHDLVRDEDGRLARLRSFPPSTSLHELLKDSKRELRFDRRRLIEILSKCARVLAFAHEHGVAHGHLDTDNIAAGAGGEPYVLGWQNAIAQGEPDYPAAARADMSAIGTLIQAVTSRFGTNDALDAIADACGDGTTYARATGIADDLDAYREHRPLKASPPTAWRRLVLTARRHPAIATAVGATLLAGAGLLMTHLIEMSQEIKAAQIAQLAARNETVIAEEKSDLALALALEQEAPTLWPPDPGTLPKYNAWLEDCARLESRVPLLRSRLNQAPKVATRSFDTSQPLPRTRSIHRAVRRISVCENDIRTLTLTLNATKASTEDKPIRKAIAHELEERKQRRAELKNELRAAQIRARVDRDDRWARIASIIYRIERLTRGERSAKRVIDARRDLAENVARRYEKPSDAWRLAQDQIRADARFGMLIDVQPDLVPLGMDRASRLQEFAFLPSGSIPRRDANGDLHYKDDAAIVFVLIPGGTTWIGAQSENPKGRNYDPQAVPNEGPPHEAPIDPIFIAKHECTAAQWNRLRSRCLPIDEEREIEKTIGEAAPREPRRNREHTAVKEMLSRYALRMPYEWEWEHAARAGGTGLWPWPGDATHAPRYTQVGSGAVLAEVGLYAPNGFGLHDLGGNAAELMEGYGGAYESIFFVRRWISNTRTVRGRYLGRPIEHARVTHRWDVPITFSSPWLGFRPARPVYRLKKYP